MHAKPALYYDLRLSIGLNWLILAAVIPALGVYQGLTWHANQVALTVNDVIAPFEQFYPLLAGLAAAHLMTIESGERFAQLRRTYPEPRWRLPLLRVSTALIAAGGIYLVGALVYRFAYGTFDVLQVFLTAFPAALFLISLGMFAATFARSQWAAVAAVLVYWVTDYQTAGQITAPLNLYLFPITRTLLDASRMPTPAVQPLLVCALALALFVGVIVVYRQQRVQ